MAVKEETEDGSAVMFLDVTCAGSLFGIACLPPSALPAIDGIMVRIIPHVPKYAPRCPCRNM